MKIQGDLALFLGIFVLGVWFVLGVNLAFKFRKFEETCRKEGIDDVEAFLKFWKFEKTKDLALRCWFELALFVLFTKILMWGG